MTTAATATTPAWSPPRIVRVACRALTVAAIVSVAGIVFLVGMFAAFALGTPSVAMALGWVNDALVIAQYVLVLPAVLAVHTVVRDQSPRASLIVAALAGVGIAGVVLFQGLLVAGRLTFEQEIGPVSIAYLPLAAWFVAAGWLASRAGIDRRGVGFGILGASYVGFPVWAWRLAGRLRRLPMMEVTSGTA